MSLKEHEIKLEESGKLLGVILDSIVSFDINI